jgi:hypothetical protein
VSRQAAGAHAKRLAVICVMMALGSPAAAQYFGRNKVRYRNFDFQVLETEHFDIHFYSAEREGVDIAARLAERWHARLERLFAHQLTGRQLLILYGSHTDFEQTNIIPEDLGEGTGGVTEPIRRRIVLPLAGPLADSDHVIGHELVHAFQFDITAGEGGRSSEPALSRLPLWFVEGMAEYVSLGSIDANTAMKLRDAVRYDRLPSIHELASPDYFPYQWGHAVWAYIAGRYGDTALPRLLRVAAASGNVDAAFRSVLGISEQELSDDWHDAIRAAYAPVLAAAVPLDATERRLIRAEGLGADLNVGPALSPDGRWIAFLSSRSVFSTDLYVADAATGRIVRKLTSTATDSHFSSIEFINSAGAWDPSSQRLAMATVVSGHAALAVFEAKSGKRLRDIILDDVDEILNPAWSRDGRAIAFTGMRQGLTDLYVYNVGTSTVAQLTHDAYTDIHPAWVPDNRHIVFATDRFSSDLASLRFGPLQLAMADAQDATIAPMPALAAGKHINPQWSPDGQAIYFIGDPDGVPNVYRLSLASHEVEQLTALDTGVSGITPTSPALSVASNTGRLAITVLENDKYIIFVREPGQPAGPPITLPVNAAALPPVDRRTGVIASLLSHPLEGLPGPQTYPTMPYKPTMSLAGVGQPAGGVGVGRFGAAASGGAALVFADTLGDHLLATAFQINTGIAGTFSANDIAVQTAYMNLARRWNWGAVGGQIPYVGAAYDSRVDLGPGDDVLVTDREIVYRQTERSAQGLVAYPFDRLHRVEFRGGFSRTSFEQTVHTVTSSLTTGRQLSDTTATQSFAPHLNLTTAAVALVMDNVNFGPTSPVLGQRYRVEIAPAVGSINFTGVLVDYRRYIMPVSFYTIAARVVHYGRYGEGGDDGRLYPVYIDNPAFVRGYSSLDYTDCVATATSACELGDRLVGSRMLVGNVELRFPLLRPFGVSRSMYGRLPVEVALFADSGVAWTGHERPAILGGTRSAVKSAGVAFRVGFGGLVSEFDVTRPFDRQGTGWVFGFNLIPGW